MKLPAKILFVTASIIYPILVFVCLVLLKVPLRIFSLFVVFVGIVYLLVASGGGIKKNWRMLVSSALLLAGGTICFFTGRAIFIKFYPVVMNCVFLFAFAYTLFFPPNVCFRLACFSDKTLSSSVAARRVEKYCKKVTALWCGFFILNGIAATATVLSKSDWLWSLYNGGISYAIMGLIFAVEFLIRKAVDKKMPKSISLTRFCADSRADDTILCYENNFSSGKYLRWRDFLCESAKFRTFFERFPKTYSWIIHIEDYWDFLCAFAALLQTNKEILLTANISPEFIKEIRKNHSTEIRFLTDCTQIEGKKIEDADFVSEVLSEISVSEEETRQTPKINADETKIVLYTSGSTGKPKAVRQRMTEFEADNAFIIKKWGEEFLQRKLCATVSQHHIYGFLFTISLPFTLAVPFRRKRIEFPSEFSALSDDSYMIIAVPAFLKRTCAELAENRLPLKNPWIFTSGGAVSAELAAQTEKSFGFCPLEVYGSTETSGIAYRQQNRDGALWTPFDNAKIWLNENDGCLTIISPYIKNPEGFKTGDLVEIQSDGRFLLKGRADSIVKIEEKRISIPEVESRIMQSGLAADCAVIALSGKRQYLAAAIQLNEKGIEKFRGTPKFLINRHFHDFLLQFFENVVLPKRWRYVEKIPADTQGKKHRQEIERLFETAETPTEFEVPQKFLDFLEKHSIEFQKIESKSENQVCFDLKISGKSDFFDGHFPDFPILPAVAQIDIVSHAANAFFEIALGAKKIRRIKFSDKILPENSVRFSIQIDSSNSDEKKLSFSAENSENGKKFSAGSWTVQIF